MVVDVAAIHITHGVRGVEAVALGQKVLERAGTGLGRLTHGAVAGRELRLRRSPLRAHAPVVNLVAHDSAGHLSVQVRQVEGGAGEADGHRIAGVQREEPDARLAPGRDVGADVQLREVGEGRNARQEARPHAGHAERRDAQPRAAVEGVEMQGGRYQGSERLLMDGPVHKEQVVPTHKENPRASRPGIGPVLCPAQNHLGPQRLHDPRNPMTPAPGRRALFRGSRG